MIKRVVAKDPALAADNWARFLTTFKAKPKPSTTKAPTKEPKKKYTPFPPANHQVPSKLDQQLESGEFFLSQE